MWFWTHSNFEVVLVIASFHICILTTNVNKYRRNKLSIVFVCVHPLENSLNSDFNKIKISHNFGCEGMVVKWLELSPHNKKVEGSPPNLYG